MNQFMEVKEAAVVGDGPWLTVAQAAELLGVSLNKTREYADAGQLDDPEPVWRVGTHRRISQKSAERLRRELRDRQT
jgi:excisionase family DNA binding protein